MGEGPTRKFGLLQDLILIAVAVSPLLDAMLRSQAVLTDKIATAEYFSLLPCEADNLKSTPLRARYRKRATRTGSDKSGCEFAPIESTKR